MKKELRIWKQSKMTAKNRDQEYMYQAYLLAEQGRGTTSPNPHVGAVIVKNERMVGQGFTQPAGGNHAEIEALNQAGPKAKGATLYVTLEPCCHHGRTPPCTTAIIKAGIQKIVIGVQDPNPQVAGKGIKILKNAGLEIVTGILQAEISTQNEIFFKYITTKFPFICLKIACSLDGKISSTSGQKTQLTGPESDIRVHELRSQYDAILIGTNTALIDNPELTVRHINGKNPIRIILDRDLKIPSSSKIFRQNGTRIIVAIDKSVSNEKKQKLKHVEYWNIPTDANNKFSLPTLFKELGASAITSVLVEGGAILNRSLLEEKLVDKLILIYTPYIFGNSSAPNIIAGARNLKLNLSDIESQTIGTDLWVKGILSP